MIKPLIKYTIEEIDNVLNGPAFSDGNANIPDEPKYAGLRKFIKQTPAGVMARGAFGTSIPKSYFRPIDNDNEKIVRELTTIINKVNDNNGDRLFAEFVRLPFAKITDLPMICSSIHAQFINCAKYYDFHADIVRHFLSINKNFGQIYKDLLMDFTFTIIPQVDLTNDEDALIMKRKIAVNNELIISLYLKKLLIEEVDIQQLTEVPLDDDLSVELLIKWLLALKKHRITVQPEIVATVRQRVTSGSFPQRLKFLIMDLA